MTTGIYKITNTKTNKFYIGSSINIENRWRQHKYSLRNNKSSNKYFQNSWNLHGEIYFLFEIIEICPKDKIIILSREQFYIDTLQPLYNMQKIASSSLGIKRSNEYKEKMKISKSNISIETKNKMSKSHLGKKLSKVHKEKIKLYSNSEKHKEKIKNYWNNIPIEQQEKLSKSHLGKKLSENTKSKIGKKSKSNWENIKKDNIKLNNIKQKISQNRKKKLLEEEINLIKTLYNSGQSIRSISKELKHDRSVINRIIKEYNF